MSQTKLIASPRAKQKGLSSKPSALTSNPDEQTSNLPAQTSNPTRAQRDALPMSASAEASADLSGAIPRHWRVQRLKFLARIQTGLAKGKDHGELETVEVPYLRVANVQDGYLALDDMATMEVPAADLSRYLLRAGDVLMNEGGDFDKLGRGHVWQGEIEPCIHQNHVFAVRPHGVRPEWLNAYTGSAAAQFYFMSRSKQSTNLASISSSNLMELPIPVPPDEEQVALLAAMARATTRIDALIEKKTRFIELLREKRQALITQAVTQGLDPAAPMKDSGDPWVGAVPKHWKLLRLRRVVSIAEGQVDPEVEPFLAMTLIGPNHIESGTGRLLFTESALEQRAESGKYLCEPGDVVYSKIRPALRKACIAAERCLCSADMYPLRGSDQLLNPYLFWYLLSEPFSAFAVLEADRVAMPKINRESLAALLMALPPLQEQEAIVGWLSAQTKKVDCLMDKTSSSLALLKERRSALITAAVTGQIDLREAA